MIFNDERQLKERVEDLTGRKITGRPRITGDTTHYMNIHGGMVLRLDGKDYFVMGDATEGRFGLDEQPKFWVKYAVDLESGARKIIKLSFYEEFASRIGPILIRGQRRPEKEARVLDAVRGKPGFMQGYSLRDKAGNLVRMIDFVQGKSLYNYIYDILEDHETYFLNTLPDIMDKLIECFEAIDYLIQKGEHHGDIRPDHIIIEPGTGKYVWIDFDFEISHIDYDLWSLGELLIFVVGKGFHTYHSLYRNPTDYPVKLDDLTFSEDDSTLFAKSHIANLGKIFPYIPEKLNLILVNFSRGTTFLYENINSLIQDMREIF